MFNTMRLISTILQHFLQNRSCISGWNKVWECWKSNVGQQ